MTVDLNKQITQNFKLKEFIVSDTAKKLGIPNTPTLLALKNIEKLCANVLQPIRDKWGDSIKVNSGYRCISLNRAVGGASTSQHVQGAAADITTGTKKGNKELFNLIVEMIDNKEIKVGQLIDESGYSWIHVSIPYTKTNQILHLK